MNAIILDAHECLTELERSLRGQQGDDLAASQNFLEQYLRRQVKQLDKDLSTSDIVIRLAEKQLAMPDVAAVLLRCMAIDRLLPEGSATQKFDRSVVAIIENGLREVCIFCGIREKDQTFEKRAAMGNIHQRVCQLLTPTMLPFETLQSLSSSKKDILGALKHSIVRDYCAPFHIARIREIIENALMLVDKVLAETPNLLLDVSELKEFLADAKSSGSELGSFLFYDVLDPFLEKVEAALKRFITSARGRFSASIKSILPEGHALSKKYPLHEIGRTIRIRLPLRNAGPGLALSTRGEASSESEDIVLNSSTITLGDITPGEFSISLDALICSPLRALVLDLIVSWGEVGSSERKEDMFRFRVETQNQNIDWPSLEYWHPYSTDPAEGDRFIGRRETVKSLASRLLRSPMEPFYITGQKRIGKTSLGKAAVSFAEAQSSAEEALSKYILWGQIAHADPKLSLAELGSSIAEVIQSTMPDTPAVDQSLFSGSLSPLVKLADLAYQIHPTTRFVIIVDEFDEIHQELFLHGNLAETFFANLRALAATKNVCLVLIGGENMPFIMERQGEKLNKFTRQNLSYFSRATEWEDFSDLVRQPTHGKIVWHDDAVSAIYNETNGNPYFTNLLCSRILRECIRLRDADVSGQEVANVLDREVASLDANSFAHLWHDGIPKPASEREPDIVRRRRVLAAIARCTRKQLELSPQNVADENQSLGLSKGEIVPTLNEFVRRDVLSEMNGIYSFNLPIFEKWLVQHGLAIVQPDQISEELAATAQALEDKAFVLPEEVASLASKWPTYQGRHVGTDEIRSWYAQLPSFVDQRLLFKLLHGLRFVSETELREKVSTLFVQINKQLDQFVRRSLADRRTDVLIAYLDGHGKSGEYFASLFAEENKIAASQICALNEVSEKISLLKRAGKNIRAVVSIDDIAATGSTIISNATKLVQSVSENPDATECKFLFCTLFATREAADNVPTHLRSLNAFGCDFRTSEILSSAVYAFDPKNKLWETDNERERAKSLASQLGVKIYKSQPLGYGGMALLIVFPNTVPNNSLPILHSSSKLSSGAWRPLFLRPKN